MISKILGAGFIGILLGGCIPTYMILRPDDVVKAAKRTVEIRERVKEKMEQRTKKIEKQIQKSTRWYKKLYKKTKVWIDRAKTTKEVIKELLVPTRKKTI